MKNVFPMLVLASSVMFAPVVFAADVGVTTAVKATVDTPVTQVAPSVSTGTSVSATSTTEDSKPVAGTLKDGTKYEIGSDKTVTLINPDGTRNVAPDGVLTNKDDTTFNVKEGKILSQ